MTHSSPLNTLAIIGLGQLGSSFGLAIRKAGMFQTIRGYDLSHAHAEHAHSIGAADHISASIEEAVSGCDVVLLCCPISSLGAVFKVIGSYASPGTIITDVSSTKRSVMQLAEQHIPQHVFIPGHPIAGIEKSGPGVADPALFSHKTMLFTPDDVHKDKPACAMVTAMWEAVGAQCALRDAREHDDVFAATSHLAQLLAYAYAPILAAVNPMPKELNKRFYRFIRIGGSDTRMWTDVFRFNARRLLSCQHDFLESLQAIEDRTARPMALVSHLTKLHDWRAEARTMADEVEWPAPSQGRAQHMVSDHLSLALAYAYVGAVTLTEDRIGTSLYPDLGGGFMGITRPATLEPAIAAEMLMSSSITPYLSALKTSLACLRDAIQHAEDSPEKLKMLLDESCRAHFQNVAKLYPDGVDASLS